MFERNSHYNTVLDIINGPQFERMNDSRKRDILSIFVENDDGDDAVNFMHSSSISKNNSSIVRYKDSTLYYGSIYELVGNSNFELPRIHLVIRSGEKFFKNLDGFSFLPRYKNCEVMTNPLKTFVKVVNSLLLSRGISSDKVFAIRDVCGLEGDLFYELFFIVDVEKDTFDDSNWVEKEDMFNLMKCQTEVMKTGLKALIENLENIPAVVPEILK